MYNVNLGNFADMFTVVEDKTVRHDPGSVMYVARTLTRNVAEACENKWVPMAGHDCSYQDAIAD